jgi:hypothetical protein
MHDAPALTIDARLASVVGAVLASTARIVNVREGARRTATLLHDVVSLDNGQASI